MPEVVEFPEDDPESELHDNDHAIVWVLHNRTYFDGAGLQVSRPVGSHLVYEDFESHSWVLTVAFKTSQAGPLFAIRSSSSPSPSSSSAVQWRLFSCLLVSYGHVALVENGQTRINSTHGQLNEEQWHMGVLLYNHKEDPHGKAGTRGGGGLTSRSFRLFIDGEEDAKAVLPPLGGGGGATSSRNATTSEEASSLVFTAGYASNTFPKFQHVKRREVLLTIVSRTYFYGILDHVSLALSDSLPAPSDVLHSTTGTLAYIKETFTPPSNTVSSRITLNQPDSTSHRHINDEGREGGGVARPTRRNQSFVLLLIGNLRTFGSNLPTISSLFTCAVRDARLVTVVSTPTYSQHTDRAWYMEKAEGRLAGEGADDDSTEGEAAKGGGKQQQRDYEPAIPPSDGVIRAILRRDAKHIEHPFSAVIIPDAEFHAFLPVDLWSKPLDTDDDKAKYFSKLTYNKILYLSKALEEAESAHKKAYGGQELGDTDLVFVARPDMRPAKAPQGLAVVAEALRQNPLRAFVQFHPVWGTTDMVFITSIFALRRIVNVDLRCAFKTANQANAKPYLEDVMEPELQLIYLLRLLCIDLIYDSHPEELLEWDKITHENDEILEGLKSAWNEQCNAKSAKEDFEEAGRIREQASEAAQSRTFPEWVFKRPFRTFEDFKSYGAVFVASCMHKCMCPRLRWMSRKIEIESEVLPARTDEGWKPVIRS
eukprot:jgi/Bigna1/82795/fgenesh1_pg.97_\